MTRARAELRRMWERQQNGEPPLELQRPKARNKSDEEEAGFELVAWADKLVLIDKAHYGALRWLMHVPNGGKRSKRDAGRMKASGVRAGAWDFELKKRAWCWRTAAENNSRDLTKRIEYTGLIIELKIPEQRNRKLGGLSPLQVDYGLFHRAQAHCMVVSYGWDMAREAIEDYLAGRFVRHQWEPQR